MKSDDDDNDNDDDNGGESFEIENEKIPEDGEVYDTLLPLSFDQQVCLID